MTYYDDPYMPQVVPQGQRIKCYWCGEWRPYGTLRERAMVEEEGCGGCQAKWNAIAKRLLTSWPEGDTI